MEPFNNTYIGAVNYVLGEQRNISEVIINKNMIDVMYSLGLENYCKFDRSEIEIAVECIKKVLINASINALDIDALILTSETIKVGSFPENIIFSIASRCGINRAQTVFLSGSECTNTANAICYAASLRFTMGWNHVIVLSIDYCTHDSERYYNFRPHDKSNIQRIDEPALTILSDGAIAFLITSEAINGYLLRSFSQSVVEPLHDKSFNGNMVAYERRAIECFSSNFKTAMKIVDDISIRKVFLPNTNRQIMKDSMKYIGMSLSQTYLKCLALNGHVFAADPFISLKDWECAEYVTSGEMVAIAASGAGETLNYTTLVLEKKEG